MIKLFGLTFLILVPKSLLRGLQNTQKSFFLLNYLKMRLPTSEKKIVKLQNNDILAIFLLIIFEGFFEENLYLSVT